jgi:hypothetical protein
MRSPYEHAPRSPSRWQTGYASSADWSEELSEQEMLHAYDSENCSLQESQYYDSELEFLQVAAYDAAVFGHDGEYDFLPHESAQHYYDDADSDWEESRA